MKVTELYIQEYNQFKNFRLDLTYPEGHQKAGQALDKVCFIGQSGTGKTSILNLISSLIESKIDIPYGQHIRHTFTDNNPPKSWVYSSNEKNKIIPESFLGKIVVVENSKDRFNELVIVNELVEITQNGYSSKVSVFNNQEMLDDGNVEIFLEKYNHKKKELINYEAGLSFKQIENEKNSSKISIDNNSNIIKIANLDFNEIWQKINNVLTSYREQEIKERIKMSEVIQNSLSDQSKILKTVEDFNNWQKSNINPIFKLAEYLDSLLNEFNLQVRTKLDFQKTEDISSIKIETTNGVEVPNPLLSTGTKQVIFTGLPLYSLKPDNLIILFDEPECSLYPNIQLKIVDFYKSLTHNCQLFFATHSPLVASSFEPWEIVELKFNDEGYVYQELYYDKEKGRHVDNYTINPQYLTWTGILQKVFDLDQEGNEIRDRELINLATLESQIKHNHLSPEKKKEKFQEYLKLATLLNWDLK